MVVSQTNTSLTETSITIAWTCDEVVNDLWYSLNGGAWVSVSIAEGQMGTYTISGLSANTEYNIITRVGNTQTAQTGSLSVTTYRYPYAYDLPEFVIGSVVVIPIFNPLGHAVSATMWGNDGSYVGSFSTQGQSVSGFNTTSVIDRLYESLPNDVQGSYSIKVVYGSNIETTNGGQYSVNESQCAPTIGLISYEDTNADIVALTGNNQDIVQNHSTLRVNVSGIAGLNHATINNVIALINGRPYYLAMTGQTASGVNSRVDSKEDIEGVIRVTDSRGLITEKTFTINMLEGVSPQAYIDVHRGTNTSATYILVNASYSPVNGNNVLTITYRAKKEGDSAYTVTGSLTNNVSSIIPLNTQYVWTIDIIMSDLLEYTVTKTFKVEDGTPLMYWNPTIKSVGINCLPSKENTLEVNGVDISRSVMTKRLQSDMTNLISGSYQIVNCSSYVNVGARLTSYNQGIKCDATKVMVSGMMMIQCNSAGLKQMALMAGNNSIVYAQATGASGDTLVINIPPTLASISVNDVIYMEYITNDSSDKIKSGSCFTVQYIG